ncbi:MAG: hypothetical protein GEU95_21675 [Rhizobiales bacterium]|nr:hypothetical protein [Hyphomicrobiales bacterium]
MAERNRRINLHYGRLQEGDLNYGLSVTCYACSAPHKASGLVRIEYGPDTTDAPLCDLCLSQEGPRADKTARTILRRYFNSPDFEIPIEAEH